jgi:acyl dehydratase
MSFTADAQHGATFRWIPRQEDFDAFADLSGDDNPIHVDPDFSSRTRFGRTVSHGMLLYTRVFAHLSALYPERTHAVQTMMFPNPAYANEELTFSFTPSEDEAGLILIEVARAADGAVTLSGTCKLGRRT